MLGISRALMIDFPNDSNVVDMSETFMFGDYLLVSPVLEQGLKTKTIYLPEGDWINYNSGKIYHGKTFCKISTDDTCFTDIPMFVKKGAIIPTQDIVSNTEKATSEYLFIDVFPSPNETSFNLYDDDGTTYGYENGIYFKNIFRQQEKGNRIEFDVFAQNSSYKPTFTNYIVKLHYQVASHVDLNKEKLKQFYSYNSLLSAKEPGFFNSEDTYGKLTYLKLHVNTTNSQIVLFKN
jgi:alpha-glucosidase